MTNRPTKYSKKQADKICSLFAEDRSIREIAELPGYPEVSTIYRWRSEHPGFAEQFAKAEVKRADVVMAEALDIEANYDGDPERKKLMVETRKWFAAHLNPAKYGTRTTRKHSGRNGGSIQR